MRTTIFNRGKGWYILGTNWKDPNDKAYMTVYFPKNTAPFYEDNGRGFSVKVIEIEEGKYGSYKNKMEITVFKYTECQPRTDKDAANEPSDPVEEIRMKNDFGGGGYEQIKEDDLPLY